MVYVQLLIQNYSRFCYVNWIHINTIRCYGACFITLYMEYKNICILQFINLINLYFDLINYLSSFNFDKVSFCWLVGSCYLGIVLFMEERYAQTWVERMLIQCRLIKLGPASMLWYSVYKSPTLCQSIWALFFGAVQHIKKIPMLHT